MLCYTNNAALLLGGFTLLSPDKALMCAICRYAWIRSKNFIDDYQECVGFVNELCALLKECSK